MGADKVIKVWNLLMNIAIDQNPTTILKAQLRPSECLRICDASIKINNVEIIISGVTNFIRYKRNIKN